MSPKRGDRVAPPPRPEDRDVRFATNDAAKGWDALSGQAAGDTFAVWQEMRSNPAPPVESVRHHRLRGPLSQGLHGGRSLPRWQIEVTGSGRVWYLADAERRTVWVVWAGTGHPEATE